MATDEFDQKAPGWDADPMHQLRAQAVSDAIRALVILDPTMKALEYGCGTGLLGFALHPHVGSLDMADSSQGMLEVLGAKIQARAISNMRPLHVDLAKDASPDALSDASSRERYGLICTQMTLHHVPDTVGILKTFYGLLERGGWLCVADLDAEDGSFHGPDFDGHLGFDRDALASKAREAGFGEIRFQTVFQISRGEKDQARDYPIFLMVARKA